MNCVEARLQLEPMLDDRSIDGPLLSHLQQCELCRHYRADWQLTALLREQAVIPPHSADFVDRVIAQAQRRDHRVGRRSMAWTGVAAALVMVSVALALLFRTGGFDGPFSMSNSPQVTLVPYEEHAVRLIIDSVAAREDATVSIRLAANLQMQGYPDVHHLTWKTDLHKGKNLLALPLVLQDAGRSHFEVMYTSGNLQKRIYVDVRAKKNA